VVTVAGDVNLSIATLRRVITNLLLAQQIQAGEHADRYTPGREGRRHLRRGRGRSYPHPTTGLVLASRDQPALSCHSSVVSIDTVLAFAALSAVLVAIPGPAVILVLKSAMLRSRGSAIVTALGVLTADMIWAIMSALGVTAVLVSSQIAFDVVRFLGAGYLIYLGVRLFFARDLAALSPTEGSDQPRTAVTRRRAYREGFISDLSNPKTVLVYASVIPQFLSGGSAPIDAFVLGVVFAGLGFLSLLVYAVVFGAAGTLLRDGKVVRNILRGSGAILVALGGGLLVQRPSH
jgi:threonine/homoserine/homoserine lactone efflux protein